MTTQEWKFTAKDIASKPDLFLSGHRACAGCGPAAALRLIMKATRGPTIVTQATGCMEIVGSIYPYTSWALPWLHTAFENAAANASGIDAALKAMRKKGKIKESTLTLLRWLATAEPTILACKLCLALLNVDTTSCLSSMIMKVT